MLQIATPVLITISLALSGYFWLTHAEQKTWNTRVSAVAEDVRDYLGARIAQQLPSVLAMGDLFNTRGEVSREEFARFSQRALEDFHGLHALAWVPRVPQEDRTRIEAEAQRDGLSDFIFWQHEPDGRRKPAGSRSEYFPLLFIATSSTTPVPIGLDIGIEVTSLMAMTNAAESADPVLAEQTAFYDQQDANQQNDWKLFVPIYRHGLDAQKAGIQTRRAALRGFVVGVFNFNQIVAGLNEHAARGQFAYKLSTLQDSTSSPVLFDNRPPALRAIPAERVNIIKNLGGSYLLLEVWPLTPLRPGQSPGAILYLAGSVLATLFLLTFVLVAAGQNVRITRRVNEGLDDLRHKDALLQRVMEASKLGYWDWDLSTGLSTYSDRRYTMLGYEPSELSGLYSEWLELLHPDDRARVDEQLNDYLEERRDNYLAEYRMKARSGEWRWIMDRGSITKRDENGRPLFMSGIYADIHNRKLAEIALQESQIQLSEKNAQLNSLLFQRTKELDYSEHFMKSVLDSLSAHIVVINQDGDIISTNRAWRDFAEKNNADNKFVFEGSNYFSVCDQAGPEGRTVENQIRDVMAGVRVESCFEYSCNSPDEKRWFNCTITRIPGEAPAHVVLAHENITTRKQLEEELRQMNEGLGNMVTDRTSALEKANHSLVENQEKLRSVIEYLPEGIVTTDENGTILTTNPALQKIFGYSDHEVVGKNITTLMPEFTRQDHDHYMHRFLQTGDAKIIGVGREIEGRHKNGQPILLELAISEYFVYGSHYFTGILRDIQAQKNILAEIERSKNEAEQANQAKSNFLAMMSHEIRTPMNGVIGMLEVLKQSGLKNHQQEMLEIIHDSAFSLLGVIEDILDFSKIEAGKLELECSPMSISSVVNSVCAMLDYVSDKADVELTMFTAPELPEHVVGDALRLRQVLINLTNNAIKFSNGLERQGKVSIRAVLTTSIQNQVEVEFHITDNGIGMDQATQQRLFQAFTQADVSTTRRFGGTGLGLVICSQLLQLMGGKITVESNVDKGSIFTARIPFALISDTTKYGKNEFHILGLSCLVIGNAEGLAGDLAAYLKAAGAVVSEVWDLISAQQLLDTWPLTPSVWVIEAGTTTPDFDLLRSIRCARSNRDIRFLVIGRGRRRRPRLEASDLVTIDGNALNRETFLSAVAMTIGQVEHNLPEPSFVQFKATPTLPSREEARRHGRLILVAEDNKTNQKVILHQLALLGYTADMADNGNEALMRWQNDYYALLLTDLHMPVMDGYQLTAAIRRMEQGKRPIPIIALTANIRQGEAQRCQEAGMNDYLSKPTQLSSLQETLTRWLSAEPCPATSIALATVEVSSKPVDVRVLAALVGDDPVVIRDFLQDFRVSTAKASTELQSAFASGDIGQAGAVAHRLKSSSRSVGALALGELCAALEEAVRVDEINIVLSLQPRLEAEIACVEAYLASL